MSLSLTTDKRLLVFVIVQYLRELIINQIGLMFKRENACFSEDFREGLDVRQHFTVNSKAHR